MDFRDLRYVTAVADCGSITEASRQLFISQPSLSYIISKIEQDVGIQLFNRKNYPLTLTYAGEKYVDTARKILRLNDNLRRELVDIGLGEKGKISFGIPTERAGYMLPRVIPEYKKLFPKVEIRIYEAMSDELLSSLLRDEVNFYIIPRSQKELPGGLQTELIYKEKLWLVAAPGI
ncbi:MAG: LysR family transcriptional regulator, partial [Eubacteriales bacterium]|nr:LysR family transcriptional regulator [Eubacteriales bacterium]